MQGANFILFAVDELGWSYFIDSNGLVQKQFQPKMLNSVPSNFSEMELKWGRSNMYAGLQQTYSVAGQFVQDAAKILRHITYTKGSEGILKLRIYKTNKQFGGGLKRELFFESEFDLSKFERQTDFVASMLMEGGAEKLIRAFENTDFEIDVDADPDAIPVFADGILFKNTLNFKVMGYQIPANNDYFLPVVYLNRDGITDATILSSTENYQPVLTGADLTAGTNWMFKLVNQGTFTFRIYGSIKFRNTAGIPRNFGYQFRGALGTVYFSSPSTAYAAGSTTELAFDQTITVSLIPLAVLEESFFFQIIPGQDSFELIETDIKIAFDFRYKPTIIKALPGLVLFKRLLKKILGVEPTVSSNLLNDATDIVFLCGDSIRGLAGSKIKTSLTKFFQFNHMVHCAGFDLLKDAGGNTIAVLEKRIDFYKNEQIVDVGEVAKFTDKIDEDFLFNEIVIGYPVQDYGEVNGRGEFNTTNKFTTPIKRTVKTLDLQTQYRADMIGAEITRINLQNKTTTDSGSDNDVFVFNIEKTTSSDPIYSPDPFYRLDRSVNASATGLIHAPSAFNIKLSPTSCLLNHGWYLRSCLFFHGDDKIIFQTNDKNADLQYNDGTRVITEKSDIQISSLPAAVFQPFQLQITTSIPKTLVSILTPKPKGFIKFSANGYQWKGFILDVGVKPVTEEEQTWKLLCEVTNQMQNLI